MDCTGRLSLFSEPTVVVDDAARPGPPLHWRPGTAKGEDAVSNNPYEAPRADVTDYVPPDANGDFGGGPYARAAGRGVDWFREAWALFAQSPGLWIAICLVLIGIQMVSGFIPILGPIAQSLLYPVFGAGIVLGCDALHRGEPLRFDHLFAGFSRNTGQLVLLGVIYLVFMLVVAVIAFVPTIGMIGGMAVMGAADPDALAGNIGMPLLIGFLIWFALLLPAMMAMWFAPALVVMNDLQAIDALKLSFAGCLRNIVPFLVYGLVGFVLAIVATIPLLLGWLVLMPVLMASIYTGYRDIFYAR